MADSPRAYPNGWCWCGCGSKLDNRRVLFKNGHDAKARAWILKQYYDGNTAQMVLAHGHGPPGPGGFEGKGEE
jgi:hypothetical protein